MKDQNTNIQKPNIKTIPPTNAPEPPAPLQVLEPPEQPKPAYSDVVKLQADIQHAMYKLQVLESKHGDLQPIQEDFLIIKRMVFSIVSTIMITIVGFLIVIIQST